MVELPSPFDPPPDASPDDLRARLRAMASLISRAPIPIAVAHDAECHFISSNAALARLLGLDTDSNISLTPPPGEQVPYRIQRGGRDVPDEQLPMQYAIAHREHVTNDIEIVRADGTVLFVQNDVEPLYDTHGEVCGCVSVCVDLTEHKKAQQMLRDADRLKDEFLATLSHELRNPLAPLRSAVEVLRRATGDPTRSAEALDVMERQIGQLVRITGDLLDVSRITSGHVELRRARTDLRAILRNALETAAPSIDAARHVVRVKQPETPMWVNADAMRMTQAIGALLSNAVTYTDRGGLIEVSAEAQGASAVLTITDSGIGIKASVMPRIFDMFMQADRALDRARGGLGVGLTLAKRLIDLHGGTIVGRSRGIGHGSAFTTTLPLADLQLQPPAAVEPAVVHERRRNPRCRVLLAEDVPDAAEMMRVMLDYMGHEVRVARDGVQAVALAKEFQPHVALLDIGLPRMDGYEAGRRIRAAMGPEILLVALTGWGQAEDQLRAREAGFDIHIPKPAEPNVLEALIASRALT